MTNQVSVDKAIKKGKQILLLIFIIGAAIMAFALFSLGKYSIAVFLILFFSAMPIGALVAAFLLYKWKYWAFENVRNVHELKKRAIEERLITKRDKMFSKIENGTENDTKYWNINQKFLQDDVFIDDLSVAKETHIYHSRSLIYFFLFIVLFLIVGIVFTQTNNFLFSGISALIVVVVFIFINKNKLKREEPLILINDKGIKTATTGFTEWKNIKNEKVIVSGFGKHTEFYLAYNTPKGQNSVLLTGTNIGKTKMSMLLILYRNRHENFQNN